MINNKFECYKLKKQIEKSGIIAECHRSGKNDFGEPDDTQEEIIGLVKGIYHEVNSYVQVNTGETTQYRNKKEPMILCLFDDVKSLNLICGDIILLNNKRFTVSKVTNICEWNIVCDISIEEIVLQNE